MSIDERERPAPPVTLSYPLKYCPWCGVPTGGVEKCGSCGELVSDRRIGTVVGDRYRIEGMIGEGGMGRVYRATHLAIGETVVLKFLLSEWAARPEARARFKREAVLLARLRHPCIVSVHDFGEHDGTPYLVMEYIQGQPLTSHLLRDGRPLPLEALVGIFEQILQVLEATHAAGVVHRDLKPENVMLLDAGDGMVRVKVLDFGIAFVDEGPSSQRLTKTGVIQGTPLYMSPEQCHAHDVGPPSDIYAVGVMLFEALAGETPFLGESSPTIMAKHIFTNPPSIGERGLRRTDLPPGLEALVMRALAKDPARRPTAAQFREELAAAVRRTDLAGRQERAAEVRHASVGQSRDERALTPLRPSKEQTVPVPLPPLMSLGLQADSPAVVLWRLSPARVEGLRDALSVHGVEAMNWTGLGPPAAEIDGRTVRAVLIAGPQSVDSTRAIRAEPSLARTPVLALDVEQAEDLPPLIRAGASDASLVGAEDGAICKQILRLIRRRR